MVCSPAVRSTLLLLALVGCLFSMIPAARADVLPGPARPDWNDPPAPLPEPPPEDGAWGRLLPVAFAVAAGAAVAGAVRSRRAARGAS